MGGAADVGEQKRDPREQADLLQAEAALSVEIFRQPVNIEVHHRTGKRTCQDAGPGLAQAQQFSIGWRFHRGPERLGVGTIRLEPQHHPDESQQARQDERHPPAVNAY